MSISAEEAQYLLEHARTVTDLVNGKEGKILVNGEETAFVDSGPLPGGMWVPLDELEDSEKVIGE